MPKRTFLLKNLKIFLKTSKGSAFAEPLAIICAISLHHLVSPKF